MRMLKRLNLIFIISLITISFPLIKPALADNINPQWGTNTLNYFAPDDFTNKWVYLQLNTPWLKSYNISTFNCSNMSTALTLVFSNYKTQIVEGYIAPQHILHAVIRIKLNGKWYWIESTSLNIMDKYNAFEPIRYYNSYTDADKLYKTTNTYKLSAALKANPWLRDVIDVNVLKAAIDQEKKQTLEMTKTALH